MKGQTLAKILTYIPKYRDTYTHTHTHIDTNLIIHARISMFLGMRLFHICITIQYIYTHTHVRKCTYIHIHVYQN